MIINVISISIYAFGFGRQSMLFKCRMYVCVKCYARQSRDVIASDEFKGFRLQIFW